MLGMMIESYEDKPIPTEAYFMLLFSPFVLPILIGMIINEKYKRDDK